MRRSLDRRLTRVRNAFDPPIEQSFLDYARALIAFGGVEPTADSTVRLARYLTHPKRSSMQEAEFLHMRN